MSKLYRYTNLTKHRNVNGAMFGLLAYSQGSLFTRELIHKGAYSQGSLFTREVTECALLNVCN